VQRPEFAAAGGDVGGYNRGWLDPGNHVMRVNGEPRTSMLTTPNGMPPARKAGAATSPSPQMPAGSNSFDSYERARLANAASSRSAAMAARRCSRTASTTITIRSCRRRTTS
jgi:hypothetical protein